MPSGSTALVALILTELKKIPYFPVLKQKPTPMPRINLEPNGLYHIYNRANGEEHLFKDDEDHLHFLHLYKKYIPPIADTFAWVLMKNHYHFLVRIKADLYYKYSKEGFKDQIELANKSQLNSKNSTPLDFNEVKWHTIHIPETLIKSGPIDVTTFSHGNLVSDFTRPKKANPTSHFGHLFNTYVKYHNKKYDRHGSLFNRNFQRKLIDDPGYFEMLVMYIHTNPIHHRITDAIEKYPWSSYHDFTSDTPSDLSSSEVLVLFGGLENFKREHDNFSHLKRQQVSSHLKDISSEDPPSRLTH